MLRFLHKFRHRLSDIDALPQLTLLGAVIGCIAGLFIVMFRYAIELPLSYFLPLNNENFEGLTPLWQFGLPVVGALIIGAGFYCLDSMQRHVSIGHVLELLHNYVGRIPAIHQMLHFVGVSIILFCGSPV